MLQHVTVTSNGPVSLKPLIETAIRSQLKSLQHGIKRTMERLAAFEQRFGTSSEEFERRFKAGEVIETIDTIDWCMEIEALRLLEEQYSSLSEAQLD